MRMRSKKWSKNILLSLLVLTSLTQSALCGPYEDAQASGAASGNQVLDLYGSQEGSNNNISIPMTSTDTQLHSVDGNTSFNASLSSPSSASFLQVMIQPSGTADLQQVMVYQDLNMDGSIDYSYAVPRMVSGVCANGYYSCTPGTWQNCTTYRWTSDTSGRVTDTSAAMTDLGGCYCINTSCGSQLVWNNSDIILKDIGGGVVASIQRANVGFMVTNVSLGPVTIDYYGRLTGTMTAASTSQTQTLPPPVTAQTYLDNPGNISSDTAAQIIIGQSDPTSLYGTLFNSSTNRTANVRQCQIQRVGAVNTQDVTLSNSGQGALCVEHFLDMRIHRVDDYNYELQILDTYRNQPHYGCNDGPGWHLVERVTIPPETVTASAVLRSAIFSMTNISGRECTTGSGFVDGFLNGFDQSIRTSVGCWGRSAQHPSYDWNYVFVYATDTYNESTNDTCSALASDPTCRLMEETSDGVSIVNNFQRTGLSPLPSCNNFVGGTGTMQVCRPWWLQTRKYMCTDSMNWDFTDLRTRYGAVVGSTSVSGNALNYSDLSRDNSGQWVSGSGSISLPDQPVVADCEMSCRTRAPHEDNEITMTGVTSSLRTNSTPASDYLYKVCVNGICPLTKPGEVVVDDCQCQSGFNEAATAIQALRMAGKDTICTSGESTPIQ